MAEFFFQVVFELGRRLTGHLVLKGVTLGGWNMSNGRDEVADLVGVAFWLAVGVIFWLAFFR